MAQPWSVKWILFFAALAVAIRLVLFDYLSGDVAEWGLIWVDYLRDHGYAALGERLPNNEGLTEASGNYTPAYYYLLWVATFLDRWIPDLYLIKLVSVAFDVMAATFMYRIVKLTTSAVSPWVGFFSVLLAPTVLLNGALWGQCDVVPHSLLLGAVYFTLGRRHLPALVCIGLAVSVKATAVFLFPYLLLLQLRGRLPQYAVLVIVLVYAVVMTPAALLGRSVVELSTVYFTQATLFSQLSMNAANLYHFIPDKYYEPVTALGILTTVIATLLFATAGWRNRSKEMTPRFLLLAATLSVSMLPFLLPKMHDRYFFAADLVSIALAVTNRRFWFVAVGFQVSSILAYMPILRDYSTNSLTDSLTHLFPIAIAINTALVGTLAFQYFQSLTSRSNDNDVVDVQTSLG